MLSPALAAKKEWRLSRTLSRQVEYRPIESEDMRHVYAAYRKGALVSMGSRFAGADLSPRDFRDLFHEAVIRHYDAAWTIFANTRLGYIPIGLVFAGWSPGAAYMIIGGVVWFPWASRRNIIEGAVAFMKGVGKEFPMMGYASGPHKRLYEVCCMHGVMRRVGTSQIAIIGEAAAVYETRELQLAFHQPDAVGAYMIARIDPRQSRR